MDETQQTIQCLEARERDFTTILDVRSHAPSLPTIPNANLVSADELTSDPARFIDLPTAPALVVCDIGLRSAGIVRQLRGMGYEGTFSLDGGMEEWIALNLPVDEPSGLTSDAFRRYDRQLKLPGFGLSGQQALTEARVAVVGAGGLGVPVATYLTGAGVGHITIIDSDRVEVSNLHRQPIYSTDDIGLKKASTASGFMSLLNPLVSIEYRDVRLDAHNAADVLVGHDIVVTCTDDFDTAHALNAAAVEFAIPMVFGSVYRTEGQLSVFDSVSGPCYACVFPPDAGSPGLDCSIVGVLGSVTGVIGAMQATEVTKILTGIGDPATGRLVLYDARSASLESVVIRKDPKCPVCGNRRGQSSMLD